MLDRRCTLPPWLLALIALCALLGQAPLAAQEPAPAAEDPHRAYEQGEYESALGGFVDRQVERPDDPALAFNVGSAHYKLAQYERAASAFARAAMADDPALRAQALYNLGNVAYRQGKLEQAVERYKAALEIDPDDEDAKHNLELVRREIERRKQQDQERQQQQEQENQQEQDQESQQGDQNQQGEQEQGEQEPSQGEQQEPPDGDGDGLPDETERQAANPTDPQNPDTDGDGLEDGEEDRNANGRVDEGETDPNDPDSDDDGVPDGAERPAGEPPSEAPQEGEAQAAEPSGELSEEEAERYLRALEEVRPERDAPRRGRRGRPEKDW